MDRLRAIIVDDELPGRQRIHELLLMESDIDIVAEYGSVSRAVAGISANRPDVLFLDVQLPRADGFSVLAQSACDPPPATIFVTAHDRYALRAFDAQAVDYLLKPFDRERFQRSLERARAYLAGRVLSRHVMPAARPLERIAVKSAGRVNFVTASEIDWIESAANYVRLHIGRDSLLHRDSMTSLESRLDPKHFVRIHRSTIVNTTRVVELQRTFNREHLVLLRDGTRLTLAAPYRGNLEAVMGVF